MSTSKDHGKTWTVKSVDDSPVTCGSRDRCQWIPEGTVDPNSGRIYVVFAQADTATSDMLRQRINDVLKTLTYREREILKLRYGIGDGYTYTLEEVGRIFKVTRERVRQVEAKAIRKLQHPVRARKLEGFLPGGVTR